MLFAPMDRSVRIGACRCYVATAALSLIMGITAKFVFEMPHPALAVKEPEPPEEVGCREVITRTRKTCYKEITTKEPYLCPQAQRKEACKHGHAGIANSCKKEALRSEPALYQRTRLERQCRSVPGTCYRREKQVREYPCLGREICTVVPTEVERTCVRRSTSQDAYPCEKHKFDRICTDIQVPVEKVCHREETRTQQYPCKKTEYKRVCRPLAVQIQSNEICFRTAVRDEEYACTKIELKRTCSQQLVEVPAACTRAVPKKRHAQCTRKVVHQKCNDGVMRKPAVCSRTVKVKQPYECEETQNRTECTSEPTCKDQKCKMRRLHQAPCRTASLLRSKTCYREIDEVQEYPCARDNADGCVIVEELVADTCTENASKEETCTEVKYQEKCEDVPVEVPSTCRREVPAQEAYPCTSALAEKTVCEHQPVEVEGTCQEQVTVEVPYSCLGMETKTECKKAKVTYMGTCHKTVPKKEEYPCTKTEKKRQCRQEQKMCSEKVLVEVPYECSRNVCEHVQVPADGMRSTNDQWLNGCSNTRKGKCSEQEVSGTRTCFRDVVAQRPFPCYKTNVTTVCSETAPHGLLVEAPTAHA